MEYFVKWIGWDHADNTWEPEAHLEGTAEDKINQFESHAKEKEQRRKEHKRKEREKDRERERQREKEKAKKMQDRQEKRRREEEKGGGGGDKDRDRKHDEKDRKRREEREKEKSKKKGDEAGLFKVVPEPLKKKEKEIKEPVIKHGFARGLQIEKILGATKDPGELMFFVKWKGGEKPELVMAKEAYAKAPQIILKWYEAQLDWTVSDQKKENAETVKPESVDNSQSVKSETEKADKPAFAKVDSDNSDVSKKEKEGMKDDTEKEEKSKEKEAKDSSKDNAIQDKPNIHINDEEKKDSKDQGSAKSVPDQPPVHKYF